MEEHTSEKRILSSFDLEGKKPRTGMPGGVGELLEDGNGAPNRQMRQEHREMARGLESREREREGDWCGERRRAAIC